MTKVKKAKTIQFSELKRLEFCNSPRLPHLIRIQDKLMMYVGFGWIDVDDDDDDDDGTAVTVVDDQPEEKTVAKAKTKSPKVSAKAQKEVDDRYDAAMQAIEDKVIAACRAAGHADVHVLYSCYPCDEDDVPVDNLDKVAVRGRVIVGRPSADGDAAYNSPVLLNPTWLQLCVQANASIEATGDYHHVFFEGLDPRKNLNGNKVRRLVMGS